jgi:hypothetical protein
MNITRIHETNSRNAGITEFPKEITLEGKPSAETWIADEFAAVGTVQTGIWVGEPGKIDVPYYPTDEIFTVTSGKIEVTNEDGSIVTIGPGETGRIRKGWKGVWHVIEKTRKYYVTIGNRPAQSE